MTDTLPEIVRMRPGKVHFSGVAASGMSKERRRHQCLMDSAVKTLQEFPLTKGYLLEDVYRQKNTEVLDGDVLPGASLAGPIFLSIWLQEQLGL